MRGSDGGWLEWQTRVQASPEVQAGPIARAAAQPSTWSARVAAYATSMAQQSLNKRSTKMECRRREAHSSASDQGGRVAVRAYSAITKAWVAR